ncbi:SEC-C metal-binding domain-containing protein [Xanthomonas citri]|uniref:SEC-C metal-binding domain-containing protein n=2 Tax=Xanthomonas TaxID=338 RepID=UPI00099888FF|nr:SEC-C metal-binding domain-containing protein [Xanthomonas citri]AZB52560.1 toxin-antitoxin system HicB family antitoxin [Xanthomonas citri pv. glycines str. 8ra]AZB52561.1 toxin-antitoxin system HicB family antitoxin [Xanthomonas citri pv. glycines str. 8ra]QDR45339.1 toxin-antitoxin system HicB family antitoxin [Xanthomonas citri pv. glycines]QDR45341.1 toxin-antitoxin system HicB family antitoxin [Xanthomonas citri pv. glycines]QDS20396.1 toxin-antitoxin system HicB family antitoxin [Xan
MNDAIHKLNLRLPMHVVEEAKAHAQLLGVSLNAYILFCISEQVKRTRRELSAPFNAAPPKSGSRPPARSAANPVVTPVKRPQAKVGRNEDCPCGSGRKAKHCHPEWT